MPVSLATLLPIAILTHLPLSDLTWKKEQSSSLSSFPRLENLCEPRVGRPCNTTIKCIYANTSTKWKSLSCVQLFVSPWNSPGQKAGMDSLSLIQEIFPTQGWNPDLPHCRQILYQLSHKGSPGILDWVSYPFSRGPSQPRNRTRVSCVAGGFFTSWATRKAHFLF